MKYIAPYILESEYICSHCHAFPPSMNIDAIEYPFALLFKRFKSIREEWGRAINISSGYRCPQAQINLWLSRQSDSPHSVHIFGLALDLDVDSRQEVKDLVQLVEAIDSDIRIGSMQYLNHGKTMVHIDVGYFISPKYSINLRPGARW